MDEQMSLALFLAMALLTIGCSERTGDSSAGQTLVRVQLNWFPEPEFGGLYNARELGLFRQAGLDVRLLNGSPNVPASQMVAQGSVEFAVIAGPQLLTLRAQGGGATGVFATFQKYPRAIAVRTKSPYESLEKLWKSDATVMGQYGLAFMKWLRICYGGTRLTFVPYTGSLAPFIAGKVDALQCFATSEPVQLQLDGIKTRLFLVADTGYNPYVGVIAVNDTFLERRPELVRRFVTALRVGWRTYLDAPQATNAVLSRLNPDMTPTLLKRATALLPQFVESEVTDRKAIGWMETQRWQRLAIQMAKLGELPHDAVNRAGTVFHNPPLPVVSDVDSER